MYKVYDFICISEECSQYNQEKEYMVEKNEAILCEVCLEQLQKLVPGPYGRVLGTSNPVKQ